jgi:hypothetical protein
MAVKSWLKTLIFGSSTEVYGTFSHEVLRRMLLVGLGAVLCSSFIIFSLYVFHIFTTDLAVLLLFVFQMGFIEGILRCSWRIGLISILLITIAVVATIFISFANSNDDYLEKVIVISFGGATGFCSGIANKRLFCLILGVLFGHIGGWLGGWLVNISSFLSDGLTYFSYYMNNVKLNIFFTVPIALTVGLGIWAGTCLSERWGKQGKSIQPEAQPATPSGQDGQSSTGSAAND